MGGFLRIRASLSLGLIARHIGAKDPLQWIWRVEDRAQADHDRATDKGGRLQEGVSLKEEADQ
jgi:hypothetical protein